MTGKAIVKQDRQLQQENDALRRRLHEMETTLCAIQNGEIDALVVHTPQGDRIFSLTSAETPYRIIVEEMNEGAAVIGKDGLILYCNASFAALIGRPLGRLVGAALSEVTGTLGEYSIEACLRNAVKSSWQCEWEYRMANGSVAYYRLSFSPLPPNMLGDICLTIADLTSLKQKELLLQQSAFQLQKQALDLNSANAELASSQKAAYSLMKEALSASAALKDDEVKFRSVLQTAEDAVILADEAHRIIYWNPSAEKLFGYQAGEVLQKPLSMILEANGQLNASFTQGRKAKRPDTSNSEMTGRRKDGSSFPVEHSFSTWLGENGRIFCEIIRDISERKRVDNLIAGMHQELEQRIRERTAQYEAVNRELESFTYSVSHDLRAPLRAVNSYAQILCEEHGPGLDDDARAILASIKYNTRKMGILIDELLAFSRLGRKELAKKPVDISELAAGVVKEIAATQPHRAKIQIGKLPVVHGDPQLLYQVLFNLISNAIKYSSKKKSPAIKIYSEEKKGKIVIVVKDNGAGFDMRFADKLFGVFQRLHSESEFEGNGVGLAIVHRIISKHGGSVWGEGREGRGARFCFTLN